ncbi:MAG TPA: hypothetical protein VFT66_07525 [Roseiflexaceae bacterium]|nr:hypothetical protein [Roseiflexaceae bacterium]
MWLFSLHTCKPLLLKQGVFRDVAWAPDGQHILALRGDEQEEAEAWLHDVSSLLRSVQ